MAKQRFKPEEIILELREVEIRQGKGLDKVVGVFPK
jgi:hypothetical protein